MDLLVLVVEDRRLDGAVEELVGVAAEELVERVLAGDVDGEPAPAPARAAPHLPQRGHGARERHDDRGVERADVDAELERVGRDDREQLAGDEPRLELAPLLRRVAGAVRRDAIGERGVLLRELLADQLRDQLDALAGLDEADRPRAAAHEVCDQIGRLADRRAALLQRLVDHGRVPHRDLAPRAGRAVAVDKPHVVEARQPLRQLDGVGDRRAREQEPRLGAVCRRRAAQPPQHVAHVRSKDAAVHVRLVDDDEG